MTSPPWTWTSRYDMSCAYRITDCQPIDREADMWTGTLPRRTPKHLRYGFVHRHDHLLCVVDGPDGETGWHPADPEPHPEPWVYRRARRPIQLAHPYEGKVLPWRVIASTILSVRAIHTQAMRAADTIYNERLVGNPIGLLHIYLTDILAPVGRLTARRRALLDLADHWRYHELDWTPDPDWVAERWGCGEWTVDAYRVYALGEDHDIDDDWWRDNRVAPGALHNRPLTLHVALRRAGRLPAVTLRP